jgi:glycosyltransferase involved in cell wall biosynthesis
VSATPLVSVIVPAFNAAPFIGRTLDSVLSQTYRHLEVLVVDDGSADATPRIAEARAEADGRVRLLRQQNQGVAAARNAGVAEARGEYVAPIDADDLWYPTKIERQVQSLERAGAAHGLAYTWWIGIDEHDVPNIRSHPWTVEGDIAEAHTALNFIGNASVPLIRRVCFDTVGGYDESFRARGAQGCEDWDLSLRIAERYRVSVVPEHLTGYRRMAGSMSGNVATMIRSHELMLERLRQRRPDVPDVLLRWSRGQLYGYTVMIGARTGDYLGAASCLLKGLVSTDVSFSSPWILAILLAKLPAPAARPFRSSVRRRMERWR